MANKRTLITKLSTDVTSMPDDVLEAFKNFIKVSFAPAGGPFAISFEIEETEEESLFEKLLQSVRSEFTDHDAQASTPDDEESSNGPRD